MVAEAQTRRMRVVRRYYGFQVFFSLLFWVPIHYEFQRRIGLGDEEIFGIQSIYYAVFCLLEIPTGLFADRIGHLRSMRAGAYTLLACNLLPVFAPSYLGMLGHFVLLALARSFVSGASSAYLYARLEELGDTESFKVVEGRSRAYGLAAKVLSWGIVGWMLDWHASAPYLASAVASMAAVFHAWSLPPARASRAQLPTVQLALGEAWSALRLRPLLVLVMLQGVALFVLGRVVQTNLFQPVLGARAFPVESYGVVMSAMALFEAVGSAYPHKLRRWLSDLDAVFVASLVTAVTLSVIALSGVLGTLVALAVFSLATGFAYPIQRQLVTDTIPDARYRATLLSVESIVDRGVNAWVVAYLGGYVATGRIAELLHLAAGVTLIVMLALQIGIRSLRREALRSR
jgi:hypothetical protein